MSTREDRRADALDWARDIHYGPGWDAWLPDCLHALGTRGTETCADEAECDRRHINCACPVAHEDDTECGPWLRENPPDVDVNGESE